MKTLSIDIETYSSEDLTKTGVYKYAEAEDFEILLFAYAYDDGPVEVIDLSSGETFPPDVYSDLINPTVLKTAFNANFEITCLREALKKIASPMLKGPAPERGWDWKISTLPADQWECTMVKSAMLGLPMSLDGVAKALNLEQQKMAAGRALIRYFSMPCKPTKSNGMRTRNLPHHDPDKWELFKDYCRQDVETERAIRNKERWFTIPQKERELWLLDQRIIGTGVLIDRRMVENAIRMDDDHKEILTAEATELTGLDNPNSPAQLKEWLTEQTGEEVTSLSKTDIPGMMENSDSEEVTRVLELRQEMAKTSTKKYQAMLDAVCTDGRVRGLLQFYGASRTGRWAGRLVQVQNLPQNHLPDLDLARETVVKGDRELVELLYGNVPDTLSQLIRTAFVAPEGHRFIVADFSAIEARVTAWLAGEKWRLDVFASHGKIYEASASQMFKVPIDSIDKGSPLRQKGKIAELALGYQGGVGALKTMGGERMGLSEPEMQEIVDSWRLANPNIVRLWYDIQEAAMAVIGNIGRMVEVRGCRFKWDKGLMWITLPSGRSLCYATPGIGRNRFGGDSITYWGINQTTRKWEKQETYGGKLVENIVQAIARDCLAHSMLRLAEEGFNIVMHVHDEVVIEEPYDGKTMDEACLIMGEPISWAPGLLLRADGYETEYYKKD
jgi:DNA polymerase